ncbi:MAG TPA: SDR family NAD(P)-dependent oxidoreductase, partial [Minicystis sp.]|nr:SDR family NAD(P)-dependent oxidoreductase [Minicystis sp.]
MSDGRRTAVVTGGNRGIGLAIATELARAGLGVVLTSRSAADGEAAAKAIGAQSHALDVDDPASVARLAADLEAVDVLLNNAGISLHGFDAKVAHQTLETNFFGAVRVTDALLPRMRRGGRVVMVSSGLGDLSNLGPELRARFSDPGLDRAALLDLARSFVRAVERGDHARLGWPSSAYAVSKASLNAFTRVLARELEGDARSILVNAACPGWVRTRMGGAGAPRSPEDGARTPVFLATLP